MKKLFFLAMMAVMSLVANAQQLELNKNVRVWDPTGLHAPAKAASVDNANVWGYYFGGADGISGLGTKSAGTFRIAIYVPGTGALKGAKIQGINLPVISTKMTGVSVWGGTTLGGTNLFKKDVDNFAAGYTQVVLDDEVQIPANGMYVGYTFTVSTATAQAEQFPIGVAQADEVSGSLYLGLSATAALDDYSGYGYGVSAMQLLVTGMTLYDNATNVTSVSCNAAAKGGKANATVNLASDCNNGVKNVSYELNVNGVKTTGSATLSPAIAAGMGKSGSFDIEFDAPDAVGSFPASIAITEVNGVANEAGVEAKEFTLNTVTRVAKRVSVVEEYTGTGCGYCPRGWAGMEYLKEARPDNSIVIAWHRYNSTDPMYVASYASLSFDGAPQCCVDRKSYPDPYYGEDYTGIHHTVDAYSSVTPTVDVIKATARFTDDDNKKVAITADTEFLTDVKDYTIAFVLTADSLSGTTSSWKQSNYYYQYTKSQAGLLSDIPALGDFCSGGVYGKSSVSITFNDVLLASTYSSNRSTVQGFTEAAAGDIASREATIVMPTKATLTAALNYNEIYANILVIDENGNIANALRVKVQPATPPCDYPELASKYDGNEPAEGEYFLYNVQLDKWLGDNDRNIVYGWTSHAEVTDRGRQFGFIKNGDTWQIDPHMGNNHSLISGGLWMDTNNPVTYWTLTPYTTGDGKTVYTITADGKSLATNAGADMDEQQHFNELWQLVTREERMALEAKTATEETPANFSWAINGGNFPVADDFWNTEWTTAFDGGNNVNAGDGGRPTWYMCNRAFESWNSNSFSATYNMENMPNGTYQLSVQGYYRDGSIQDFGTKHTDGTEVIRAYYFANDVEAPFQSIIAGGADEKSDNRYYYNADGKWVPDNLQAASAIFFEGGYWNEPITITVTDGKITLGVKKEGDSANGNWTVFDTFTLKYLGDTRFVDATYAVTEDTNEPAVAVRALGKGYGVSTVFVDKYNYNNVVITVVDENGDVAANVVDSDDNYELVINDYMFDTTCDMTTLILDQELADGEYTITFPAGCLVMGDAADFQFNQNDIVKLMKVDSSSNAKLVRVSETNGIANVAAPATNRVYNLQGVEVKNANVRGLYIVNGKKYIVK